MNLHEQTFIKNEYPAMPEEIKNMVNDEVYRQINKKEAGMKKSINKYAKAAALALILGAVTAGGYATAHRILMLRTEKVGNYAAEISMENGGKETDSNKEISSTGEIEKNGNDVRDESLNIPPASIDIKNRPENWIFAGLEHGSSKINIFDEDGNLPATIYTFALVDGYKTFKISDTNVNKTEEFNINGNPATYVELNYVKSGAFQTTSKVYIVYPKLNRMVMIWGHNGTDKETMINLAQNIVLEETDNPNDERLLSSIELRAGEIPFSTGKKGIEQDNEEDKNYITFATREDFLSNLHKIGDEVVINDSYITDNGSIDTKIGVKITSVKVCDNLSQVPESLYNNIYCSDIKNSCDSEGNFIPEEIQYVNYGDGINSVDEVVKTEKVNEKLVIVEFEYTNRSGRDLEGYGFFPGFIVNVRQKNDGYEIYNYDTLAKEAGVDAVIGKNYNKLGLCSGWDNGEDDWTRKNSFGGLKNGESHTVYSAFFVNENQLSDMYLDILCGREYNGAFGYISDNEDDAYNALDYGYFDISR